MSGQRAVPAVERKGEKSPLSSVASLRTLRKILRMTGSSPSNVSSQSSTFGFHARSKTICTRFCVSLDMWRYARPSAGRIACKALPADCRGARSNMPTANCPNCCAGQERGLVAQIANILTQFGMTCHRHTVQQRFACVWRVEAGHYTRSVDLPAPFVHSRSKICPLVNSSVILCSTKRPSKRLAISCDMPFARCSV